ncbi:DUF2631 domain-containing protein [Geodermatophilus sp. URMC 63]
MSEQHRARIAQDNPATTRVNQPGREEGVARAGEQPIEHERPEDWGWHGRAGKWAQVAGWLTTLAILSYLWGNHEGRMEDLWLVGIAAIMIGILLWDLHRKRTAWRP